MDNKELTAKELFENIKEKKEKITHQELINYYQDCLTLIEKFKITGQKKSLEKLLYHITCMEKEIKLLDMGIDTYINYQDIKEFLDRPENKEVLIVELENYPRDIPNEIIETIKATKDTFNNLYVLFTDYTGEIKKELKEKKDKEKDPILLGAFVDNRTKTKLERFYYLGDWVDEYCDLTLEKLIASGVKTNNIKYKSLKEITEDINNMKETDKVEYVQPLSEERYETMYSTTIEPVRQKIKVFDIKENKKNSFFNKVKTVIKRII